MMVDSVLKELGRAEAGLASRNRSVLIPFALHSIHVQLFKQATSYDVSTFHPTILHLLL